MRCSATSPQKNGDARGKREAVAHLRTSFEVSERRACAVLGADRTSVRYRSGPTG